MGIFLCDQKHIDDLSYKFHLHTVKPISSHFVAFALLLLTDSELLADPTEYWSMVGILQYLIMIHPDITYATHVALQFMHVPNATHIHNAKCIFRYL